jgi:hypothetical protein
VKAGISIPDCPGGITQMLGIIAGWNVNLISVFSKIKVCYQSMYLELFMDIGKSGKSAEDVKKALPEAMSGLNGVYALEEFIELNRRSCYRSSPTIYKIMLFLQHCLYIMDIGNIHMFISGYTRMDTTIRPGSYLSVVRVSRGEGKGHPLDEVAAAVRADIDVIDGVAVRSEDSDPLSMPGLYTVLKRLKLPGRDLMLMTEGRGYSDLDDLVGAGYVNYVDLLADGPLDKEQKDCLRLLKNCGCPFMVTVTLTPGRISESSLKELAADIEGSKHLVLRTDKKPAAGKAFGEKEAASLANSVRRMAKDVRLVTRTFRPSPRIRAGGSGCYCLCSAAGRPLPP